jgi:anti-anti-sigma regulatory factor
VLALSGRLVGDWIAELARSFELANPGRPITLDLSDVTFVSNAGAALLRELIARGARLEGCPAYLGFQLEGERR